jgi:hypothetical protein
VPIWLAVGAEEAAREAVAGRVAAAVEVREVAAMAAAGEGAAGTAAAAKEEEVVRGAAGWALGVAGAEEEATPVSMEHSGAEAAADGQGASVARAVVETDLAARAGETR